MFRYLLTNFYPVSALHTGLKCNLVNFEIPNRFLYYGNDFGIIKIDKITFQMGNNCTYVLHSSEFHGSKGCIVSVLGISLIWDTKFFHFQLSNGSKRFQTNFRGSSRMYLYFLVGPSFGMFKQFKWFNHHRQLHGQRRSVWSCIWFQTLEEASKKFDDTR